MWTAAIVWKMIVTNSKALEAAILAMQARQTAEEQITDMTKEQNGVGWSGVDSKFMGSLAKWIDTGVNRYNKQLGTTLSPKQKAMAIKCLAKYKRQLTEIAQASGKPVPSYLIENSTSQVVEVVEQEIVPVESSGDYYDTSEVDEEFGF